MAEISKVTLPNNIEYDLKVYTNHIAPMMSKTFENVIATSDTDPQAWLYFGQIKPINYNTPWKIQYRIHSTINDLTANQDSYFEIKMQGMYDTYYKYSINNIQNLSYKSLFAHILYCCNNIAIENGDGPLLGIKLQDAYNPTQNSRKYKIDIIETENCEFTFFDEMVSFLTAPENYINRYDFEGNNHQSSGDDDDDPEEIISKVNSSDYMYIKNANGKKLATVKTVSDAVDKHFIFIQELPLNEWRVQHNLGKFPSVTVIDSAGTEVIGQYTHIDINTTILNFSGAFSGKAYFN